MPYVSVEVDIDIDEIYDELTPSDRRELIEWLHKDGHLTEYIREYNEQTDRSNQLTDESFVTDCVTLGEAFYRMSDADIQIVRDMVNKYKYH
jgi:hypothetical protein